MTATVEAKPGHGTGMGLDKRIPFVAAQAILLLLCFTVAKERSKHPSCHRLDVWLGSCNWIFGTMVLLQGVQIHRSNTALPGRIDRALATMLKFVTGVMGCVGLVGLGLTANSSKCSTASPFLWWTSFTIAWLVLLCLVLHGCAWLSRRNPATPSQKFARDTVYLTMGWTDEDLEYNYDGNVNVAGAPNAL
ncbi:putative transmembrane protein, partial [Toxoplasma gondii MAS]